MEIALAERLPTVAVVMNALRASEIAKPPTESPWSRAFFEGMKERGWVDGRNVKLVWRSAEQHPERVPAIIDELVRMKVDVIVASGNYIARAAVEKTRTIPIVLGTSEFAVEAGLVQSYAQPGGNVTGLSTLVSHLEPKRMGILKELAPKVSRIAVLGYPGEPSGPLFGKLNSEALRKLGLSGIHVRVDRGEDIEEAFDEAIRRGADGMIISSAGPMFLREVQARIHELAIRHRIPVLYAVLNSVETGGLVAYAADHVAGWRRASHYVDRILRGESPARLPIENPTSYLLHINRRAAAAIGLHIPASILIQADRVFD
jgi:putative ABC transport system substrate-binding protein